MKFTVNQYAEALHAAFADTKPSDQDKIIANFIDILKRNGDLGHYEVIITEYERIDRAAKGVREIEVTLARNVELNGEIIKGLNDAVGQNIEIRKKVDESLIGGVVVRVEDTLIDGSVKHHLSKLRKTLSA